MALNVGSIVASIRLNTQNFVSGINQAQAALRNAFGSQTQSNINAVNSHLKSMERIVGGILISQAFYQMSNEIQKATGALFEFMNNMEKAQIGLEYFLRDSKEASAFLWNMKDFAAETSFNTQQALQLSRKLMAAQFDPKNVRNIMEILNDASVVGGSTAEQIDRIVLALTQMKTNGKITGQEMRQLAEANIPIYEILGKQLNLTGEQIMNIGDLKIKGDLGVLAVLKGLEEKYKGAAMRVANTVPGMWETIRDDMLMIGQGIFETPYREFEKGLRKIRDAFEAARDLIFKGGWGQLFESMFAPEQQQNIRLIAGSVMSLAQSFRILVGAISPAFTVIGQSVALLGATVLPPIAAVVRAVSSLAYIAGTTIPPVKYLVAAIIALSVGSGIARVLMILWKVTGMGIIASTVAGAVTKLRNAIVGLAVVSNWYLAIGAALVALLAYIGHRLGIFSAGFGKLQGMFGKMAGFDMNKIFAPKPTGHDTVIDKYNESVTKSTDKLKEVGKGLKDVGDKAKKAGKKVKDMFLASFDEVFQIPEGLDEAKDALKGVGDETEGLDMPSLGGGGLDMGGGLPEMPVFSTETWMDGFKDSMDRFINTAKDKGKEAWNKFWEFWKDVPVLGWIPKSIEKFQEWKGNVVKIIGDWLKESVPKFAEWAKETGPKIADWAKETYTKYQEWKRNVVKTILEWRSEGIENFKTWVKDTTDTVIGWTADILVRYQMWKQSVIDQFEEWRKDTGDKIKKWSDDTASDIAGWVADVVVKFVTWKSDTVDKVKTWATDTGNRFKQWKTDAISAISGWSTDVMNKFTTWKTDTIEKVRSWSTDTYGKFTKWRTDTVKSVSGWVSDMAGKFTEMANKTKLGQWVADRIADFNKFVATVKADGWAAGFAKVFSSLRTTVTGVFNGLWDDLKTIINGIIDMVNRMINRLNSVHINIPKVKLPGLGEMGGGSIGFNIPNIPHLATGGIVLKDQLIRAGEGNKREAVVPLENGNYMRPFSQAVANDLMSMLGESAGFSNTNNITNLHVGVLIGDERSYKELERKLNTIRQSEATRGRGRF